METNSDIFHPGWTVTDLDACAFYHTQEIPGYGLVDGEFDLRGGERAYLGGVNLEGRRVLEMGTASGFLARYMESQGAEVVAYDLSPAHEWDIVPYAQYDFRAFLKERQAGMQKQNNAFWLAHRAHRSAVRMVYGTVYEIPAAIGPVDLVTLGAILLHVRDPFLVLQRCLAHCREKVVVTEILPSRSWIYRLFGKIMGPIVQFGPDHRTCEPRETWWILPPETIVRYLSVLGFEKTRITFHRHPHYGKPRDFYTVVGQRTRPFRPDPPAEGIAR